MTLNAAVVPLKATLVVHFKLLPRMIAGILYSASSTGQLDWDTCDVHTVNFCSATVQVRPFYLTPWLIALAYFWQGHCPLRMAGSMSVTAILRQLAC